ncbi:UDP-2,3-diacylglucosamine diphosphatase [Burkholderiaceae bacterium FT117]|nr:UDP-2,3-diacylglucosamine diphosphatase [Zeimonas sediminis]
MHLGDHDPATAALFLDRLEAAWPRASHVFLLGDLFEAWVGDDQPDEVAAQALAAFARIAASGRRLFVMRGNRDFLLDAGPGSRFAERCGATMLADPCLATLFGEPVVLAHGDALCTDDVDYQRIRAEVRTDGWQAAFLARPLPERLAIALSLRAESERVKASRYPSDVNRDAVEALLRAAGAAAIVHGHTHRPARHAWRTGGPDGRPAVRWVLPDWDAADGRGGFLWARESGFEPEGWTTAG